MPSLWGGTAIVQAHHIRKGSIHNGCDIEEGMRRSDLSNPWLSARAKHTDLIRAIRRTTTMLPIEVEFFDIAGHLDSPIPCNQLPLANKLSACANRQAKIYLHLLLKEARPPLPQRTHKTTAGASPLFGKVTTDPTKAITNHVYHDLMRGDYTSEKQRIDPNYKG